MNFGEAVEAIFIKRSISFGEEKRRLKEFSAAIDREIEKSKNRMEDEQSHGR